MIKWFFLGFTIYACSMSAILWHKYKQEKRKDPTLNFLVWLNLRVADLNTTILLKGAEMRHKKYLKALAKMEKKKEKKKKKQMEKWGFK